MPQLTMPNVGEGVAEGTVTRWLKQEGDDVALDEPVVEVETDKAVVEIPSPFAGTMTKILVPEGGVVPIGAPLAEFGGADATAVASIPTKVAVDAAAAAEAAAPLPDRATATGDDARARRRADASNGAAAPSEFRRTRQYSPVVMKLAAEHGIDLALVRGTGIEGRITRQDVMRYLENPALHTVSPSSSEGVVGAENRRASADVGRPSAAVSSRVSNVRQPSPAVRPTDDTTVPLTPTRRTIAARMLESHQTIPAAWMAVEADVTGLVALRERLKHDFARTEGVRLTYMPFFVQAIVGALKQHPAINATFIGDAITLHAHQHMGVAVATAHGLFVPVIRDAGDKSIAGLARELDALGAKARERKLTVEEMLGATLTIDNTGAFGSVLSQPIIPVGQAAIITTEAIRRELRPIGDAFGVRSVMNLCISIDHRALDGAQAGAFMGDVKSRLEAYDADRAVY